MGIANFKYIMITYESVTATATRYGSDDLKELYIAAQALKKRDPALIIRFYKTETEIEPYPTINGEIDYTIIER